MNILNLYEHLTNLHRLDFRTMTRKGLTIFRMMNRLLFLLLLSFTGIGYAAANDI